MTDDRGEGPKGLFRLSGAALARALAAAEARCRQAGEALTPARRRVLELLLTAGAPVKAYDLIGAYQARRRPVAPPTVYRSLAFLERQGLAHRLESINAFVACGAGERRHAAAFLICEGCGAALEFEPDLAAEAATAAAAGYRLNAVTLEVRGLCPACQS
jgi:Fur family zinc uptake transcriptional regulator